jgi:hypothetical protein
MKSYLMSGTFKNSYLECSGAFYESHGDDFFPELFDDNLECRKTVQIANWTSIEIKWSPPDDARRKVKFSHAMGLPGIRGFHTVVSEEARRILEPYVAGECIFLPVSVPGSGSNYYILYVTRLIDCLNLERTKFGRIASSGLPATISIQKLNCENVDGFIFRLAGGRGYQFDYDFATDKFVDLVTERKLSGFRFREDMGSPEFGT